MATPYSQMTSGEHLVIEHGVDSPGRYLRMAHNLDVGIIQHGVDLIVGGPDLDAFLARLAPVEYSQRSSLKREGA